MSSPAATPAATSSSQPADATQRQPRHTAVPIVAARAIKKSSVWRPFNSYQEPSRMRRFRSPNTDFDEDEIEAELDSEIDDENDEERALVASTDTPYYDGRQGQYIESPNVNAYQSGDSIPLYADGPIGTNRAGVSRRQAAATLLSAEHKSAAQIVELNAFGVSGNLRGIVQHVENIDAEVAKKQGKQKPKKEHKETKLGELPATAISGNDIISSCLYVIGLTTYYSGPYAPFCFMAVGIMLYMFKSIYTEVVSALPLNGASYTLLLNTTSKFNASMAACLTIISYISTAVVSGSTAIYYLSLLPYCAFLQEYIIWATIVLLFVFALIALMGITESSVAAVSVFITHLVFLTALIILCFVFAIQDNGFQLFVHNWRIYHEDLASKQWYEIARTIASGIFFGFGSACLGITGFESSANFVESQKPGVFPKTLRNMWALVTLFNPLLSIVSLCVLPLDRITDISSNNLLSRMARVSGGEWFGYAMSLDAALVLSGGVLTSYVGVVGLVRRMASDRALPAFFLRTNWLRGTNHWIILLFFLLCSSLMIMLRGNTTSLSGVYTVSFLSVMLLFAIGDLMMKYTRSKMKRAIRAMKTTIFIAFILVTIALTANILAEPQIIGYFLIYYAITAFLVAVILWRIKIINILVWYCFSKVREFKQVRLLSCLYWFFNFILRRLVRLAKRINSQSMIYMTKDVNISVLNDAILYVLHNESTNWLRICHIYDHDNLEEVKDLEKKVKQLDEIYTSIRIDFIAIRGQYTPETVDKVGKLFDIPSNLIFQSSPSESFPYELDAFKGVRIITSDYSYWS